MSVFGSTSTERVTQEVERLMLMRAASVIVFAVHDFGFLRMEFQTAFRKTLPKCLEQCFSLNETANMHDGIVGIPRELDRRMIPPKPVVEGIVHKQIRQQGTAHLSIVICHRFQSVE
jgi:hypothetical protein